MITKDLKIKHGKETVNLLKPNLWVFDILRRKQVIKRINASETKKSAKEKAFSSGYMLFLFDMVNVTAQMQAVIHL